MKITVLSENYTSAKEIVAEHGLSLYIETNGKNILFDMGQSSSFFENAKKMNIDIKKADAAILSHGHYDHGGGAEIFLSENTNAPLYVNANAFGDYYSKNGYIGLDKKIKTKSNIVLIDKKTDIFDFCSLYMAECVPQNEKNYSSGLEKEISGVKIQDDFLHEQYMLVEENGKRILFSGCSHRGILNIMERFKPDIFMGGFHLSSLEYDSFELLDVAEKLNSYNTIYYTCHCTGIDQYAKLKQILNTKINYIKCSQIIVL